jgi:hypothetical protein
MKDLDKGEKDPLFLLKARLMALLKQPRLVEHVLQVCNSD